jgi:hypothetical protein
MASDAGVVTNTVQHDRIHVQRRIGGIVNGWYVVRCQWPKVIEIGVIEYYNAVDVIIVAI